MGLCGLVAGLLLLGLWGLIRKGPSAVTRYPFRRWVAIGTILLGSGMSIYWIMKGPTALEGIPLWGFLRRPPVFTLLGPVAVGLAYLPSLLRARR